MFLSQPYSIGDQEYARNRNLQKLVLLTTDTFRKIDNVITRAFNEEGVQLVVVSGRRSFAQQKGKFEQGRTTPGGIITNAQAGYSWHNFSRAGDLAKLEPGTRTILYDYPEINKVGRIAQEEGLTWGGTWGDPDHMHNPAGTNLAQLRAANPGWEQYQVKDTVVGKLSGFLKKNRKKIAYGAGTVAVLGTIAYIINERRAYV